ncbi:MAG TPA: L,D-transpeptidase family protein [Solirubrobacteraceae bacterium]|jgi:lipoprotein-anchoring transpeptidase ErfK/SrfK|nr:L,D-transpeptidase family protein [Solirubrobacteraceae bacterium]
MLGSNLKRRSSAVLLIVALMLGIVVAGAAAYDHARADRLAKGIRVDGVDIGGLTTSEAAARLRTRALQIRRRSLYVHAAGQTFELPAGSVGVTAEVDDAVAQVLATSRQGWFGSRALRDLTGAKIEQSIALRVRYAPGVVPQFVARVRTATDKSAVDATVKPTAAGLTEIDGHDGVALDAAALSERIASALIHPTLPAQIDATVHSVAPTLTREQLAKRFPAYIVVDRKAHKLRFFQHLKLTRTFAIAVGKSGLETPVGLYNVQWKEVNPPWHVPDSDWAGALRGKTIPPGPDDPIKSRWMAFDGGAGIHGIDPSEYSSIGHDASHGCVRMRIPDVISLYARTPVGTPVYVA